MMYLTLIRLKGGLEEDSIILPIISSRYLVGKEEIKDSFESLYTTSLSSEDFYHIELVVHITDKKEESRVRSWVSGISDTYNKIQELHLVFKSLGGISFLPTNKSEVLVSSISSYRALVKKLENLYSPVRLHSTYCNSLCIFFKRTSNEQKSL